MRANHISRVQRIKSRIGKLGIKLDNAWGRFGDGNPYRRCKGCDKASPEITISGHGKWCWVKGLEGQLRHFNVLLQEAQEEVVG